MLDCTVCQEQCSAYLDLELEEGLRAEIEYHLEVCPVCQTYVRELRAVQTALVPLSSEVAIPDAWSRQWVAALEQASVPEHHSWWQPGAWTDWLQAAQPLLAGYGVGIAVTCVLFSGILFSFKPIFSLGTPDYKMVYIQANTRPTMDSSSIGMANLPTQLAAANQPMDCVIFIAEVSPQGKAQLVEMVSPTSDPEVVAQISDALGKSSFQPATYFGHPVSSRVVLMIEQIYVRG